MCSAGEEDDVCANCGIAGAGVESFKLEECDGCNLVKYCSNECREDHREQHEKDCKNFRLCYLVTAISEAWNAERAAEIRDEILFRQPENNHWGDCPICFLPLPLDPKQSSIYSCCSKIICNGCIYADRRSGGVKSCPFCREPHHDEEETRKRAMKRVQTNDPDALRHLGLELFNEGNYDTAVEYQTKAAELGDFEAHYMLGCMHYEGKGVEKEEGKAVYHWEKAAIGGHAYARYNLACIEEENGNMERALKHYIIAAKLGYEVSMKELWTQYSRGNISKEDLEATLRTHKTAIDAMKSSQREIGDKLLDIIGNLLTQSQS